jgi:hypothetical protein
MPFKVFTDGNFLTTADIDLYLMSQVVVRCTSATHPSFPEEGMHIYETDTHTELVYESGEWVADLPIIQRELIALKAADESSSSTTDHDDTHLFVSVAAQSTYIWDSHICAISASNGTIFDIDFAYPANCTINYVTNHPVSAEEGPINKRAQTTGAIGTNIFLSTNGTVTRCLGMLQTTDTAGTFKFRWRSTSGVSITVKQNSFIRLRKVI